jgi:hypothetical protein
MRFLFGIFFMAMLISLSMSCNLYSDMNPIDKIIFLAMFKGDKSFQVWSISIDGKNLTKITDLQTEVVNLFKLKDNAVGYRINHETAVQLNRLNLNKSNSETLFFYNLKFTPEKKYEVDIAVSADQSVVALSHKNKTGYDLIIENLEATNLKTKTIFVDEKSPLRAFQFSESNPTLLYFVKANRNVFRIDLKTGVETKIYSSINTILSFSVSSNMKLIAVNYFNREIKKADLMILDENLEPWININGDHSSMEPSFSNDSRYLVYVDGYGEEENRIILFDTVKKTKKIVFKGQCSLANPILTGAF